MNFPDYIKNRLPDWPNWINVSLYYCNLFGKYAYGRNYLRILNQIDSIDSEKRLLEIVNYAIEHVAYYRNRYGNLHINSIHEFEERIKPIDKNEVMSHWEEFCCDDVMKYAYVTGTTGGTSGKPMKLLLPRNRYLHSLAFWHKELKWYGWNYDAKAVIRNHKLAADRIYKVNPITKEFYFDAFRVDTDYSRKIWQIMRRYHIKYLYAYPSGGYQFLKYCHNQSLDLSFIRLCILSSEDITENQRYFIEQELHIPIYATYGHSEKLIRAATCPYSEKYHIEPCYGYCELIDSFGRVIQSPNQEGELVGTTFINRLFPLIRYRTGDYSSYADTNCMHHKSYKLLNRIQGHWDKSIIYRSDGGYTSIAALNLHGEIYEHIDGLQYIQHKKGQLTVLIIPNRKYIDSTDTPFLKKHFENALGTDSEIELQFVNKLQFQPNGKFMPLITTVK